MADKPAKIDVPSLRLRHCTVGEHAQAYVEMQCLPYWWYQGVSRLLGNYSLPFRDENGHWWFRMKPGFCWPVDAFRPIPASEATPPWCRSYVGYQHVLPDDHAANSYLVINYLGNLSGYGPASLNAKRRNAIRKGFKACELGLLASPDEETMAGCRAAWNALTARTGWKHASDPQSFAESWRMLLGIPGVSIVVGRHRESGQVAGFLITKIIGDTAYVDTIASRTDLLGANVNDALLYAFLKNAAEIPGVDKAHYAIKSNVESLEKFKRGLGFEPHSFASLLRLRPGIKILLKLVAAEKYERMLGRFGEV